MPGMGSYPKRQAMWLESSGSCRLKWTHWIFPKCQWPPFGDECVDYRVMLYNSALKNHPTTLQPGTEQPPKLFLEQVLLFWVTCHFNTRYRHKLWVLELKSLLDFFSLSSLADLVHISMWVLQMLWYCTLIFCSYLIQQCWMLHQCFMPSDQGVEPELSCYFFAELKPNRNICHHLGTEPEPNQKRFIGYPFGKRFSNFFMINN